MRTTERDPYGRDNGGTSGESGDRIAELPQRAHFPHRVDVPRVATGERVLGVPLVRGFGIEPVDMPDCPAQLTQFSVGSGSVMAARVTDDEHRGLRTDGVAPSAEEGAQRG